MRAQITPPAQSPTGLVPPTLPQVPASRGNPFGLTTREIEVLRLYAGADLRPNRGTLVISPRTADAHLRSIYSKLGVTSRSAATRCAFEHQLI